MTIACEVPRSQLRKLELLDEIVEAYRARNPRSRAVAHWTYYGSGGKVRRATCIYCRRVVATCSADWPETVAFGRATDAHAAACSREWFEEHKLLAAGASALAAGLRELSGHGDFSESALADFRLKEAVGL